MILFFCVGKDIDAKLDAGINRFEGSYGYYHDWGAMTQTNSQNLNVGNDPSYVTVTSDDTQNLKYFTQLFQLCVWSFTTKSVLFFFC